MVDNDTTSIRILGKPTPAWSKEDKKKKLLGWNIPDGFCLWEVIWQPVSSLDEDLTKKINK